MILGQEQDQITHHKTLAAQPSVVTQWHICLQVVRCFEDENVIHVAGQGGSCRGH